MKVRERTRRRFAAVATIVFTLLLGGAARAQVTFTIDDDGATIGFPDSFGGMAINEGDLLTPAAGIPLLGPLVQPGTFVQGGGPGLGIPTYPATSEVDAFSYGLDINDPAIPPDQLQWRWSVDDFAIGSFGALRPPTVDTEGARATRAQEACGDVFIPAVSPPGPLAPFFAPSHHTGTIDGNGFRSSSGFGYPGVGLLEGNPPGGPMGLGDNIDGLDIDGPVGAMGFFFSLEGALVDPITGAAGSGSAGANGFLPGDVIANFGAGPVLYAPSVLLGLDITAPAQDDLDALVIWENGSGAYEPSQQPYDWLDPGGPDMLLFSVRRGSAIIGVPDANFGVLIEEGDILYPVPGGPPGIWYAAENLGMVTQRFFAVAFGDDLDALDISPIPIFDCNGNGFEDSWDFLAAIATDLNQNGIPDSCDIASGTSSDLAPPDGIPDEVQCGGVSTYPCPAKVNSLGCTPIIWSKGTPCATCPAPFTIDVVNIISAKNGLLFYGFAPTSLPFLGGTLCVAPPLRRTPIMNSFGVIPPNTCSGSYTFDMNGWIASGTDPFLVPGTLAYAQYWYRDPLIPDGTGVGLSDATRFAVCP